MRRWRKLRLAWRNKEGRQTLVAPSLLLVVALLSLGGAGFRWTDVATLGLVFLFLEEVSRLSSTPWPLLPFWARLGLLLRFLLAREERGALAGKPFRGRLPVLAYDLEREKLAFGLLPEGVSLKLPELLLAALLEANPSQNPNTPCPGGTPLVLPWGEGEVHLCAPRGAPGLGWAELRLLRVGARTLKVEPPMPLARLGELLEDGAAFPHLFGPRVPPGLARRLLEAPITRETAALLDRFLEGGPTPSGPPTGGQEKLSPTSGRT